MKQREVNVCDIPKLYRRVQLCFLNPLTPIGINLRIMITFIKQLFCKHDFVRYWQTAGNMFFHTSQWYYDDWQVDCCKKCGKEKTVNPTKN